MSEKSELALLVDIAKLMRKHGPEAFERLSQLISSPGFSETLVAVLSAAASASRKPKPPGSVQGRPATSHNLRSSLVALSVTEPEKSDILLRIYDGLASKSFLPSLRDMKAFAADNGLPPLRATSRDKASGPFIRSLMALEVPALRLRAAALRPVNATGDRSLEGWSNVILGEERRSRKGNQAP